MRIITGSLGGRTFNSPQNQRTHPMSDKIRGALFNVLGDIDGLTVLDAFAGSGAVSFEAISRGAIRATAIENDRGAQRTILENIKNLGLEQSVQLIQTSVQTWQEAATDARFDVVVIDPPYDNVQTPIVTQLFLCADADGIVVLSWPGSQDLPTVADFSIVSHKKYGDAQLGFYKRA